MGYEVDGFWAMPFCIGIFFLYTYFKGKYNRSALWIGIISLGLTIWVLYESWKYDVLIENIEHGVYLIVICFVIGFAGKISFDRRKKKREAKQKENDKTAQEVKEINIPIRGDEIITVNNKVSAHLSEYFDFIEFNEYSIGKEIYGASMYEEFHTQIKIQNIDIGKFNYDLILKFLNESTKHENYLSPSISLQGLCREYSIKYEEKYEKLKELTSKESYDESR